MKLCELLGWNLGYFIPQLTAEENRECGLIQFEPKAWAEQVKNLFQAIKGLFHRGIMPAAQCLVYPPAVARISN
jgi:hypothetical protein